MQAPDLLGLVLAGGQSFRMGTDKGRIVYSKLSTLEQRDRAAKLLADCGIKTFLSCRSDQVSSQELSEKIILDRSDLAGGPGTGILSAHLLYPEVAWLVLACDFPFAGISDVEYLISQRQAGNVSTAYLHPDGTIEPLFTIWEPETLKEFLKSFSAGLQSPRRILEKTGSLKIKPLNSRVLINVNSPKEREENLLL